VSRYLKRVGRNRDKSKAKRWLAFLNNHREVIAAFDFFTLPTMTFRVLYCFFVIEHERRRILHFNATTHPTGDWVVQQLREALSLPCRYRYVLFDRDAKFVAMYASFSRPAASSLFVRVFGARGRTESRSVGSEMFAARHSITSFPSMSSICAGWGASIWPTITPTEPTSGWRRHRRQGGGLRLARTGRAKSRPCLVSAVFIIVTPGQSRPDPADQFRHQFGADTPPRADASGRFG